MVVFNMKNIRVITLVFCLMLSGCQSVQEVQETRPASAVPPTVEENERSDDERRARRICANYENFVHISDQMRCDMSEMRNLIANLHLIDPDFRGEFDCEWAMLAECRELANYLTEFDVIHALMEQNCADSEPCRSQGRCGVEFTEEEGDDGWIQPVCIPTDEGCAQASICNREGLCAAGEDRCVADSAEDCERSQVCAYEGRCDLVDQKCLASAARPCSDTDLCRFQGLCVTGDDGKCHASTRYCPAGEPSLPDDHRGDWGREGYWRDFITSTYLPTMPIEDHSLEELVVMLRTNAAACVEDNHEFYIRRVDVLDEREFDDGPYKQVAVLDIYQGTATADHAQLFIATQTTAGWYIFPLINYFKTDGGAGGGGSVFTRVLGFEIDDLALQEEPELIVHLQQFGVSTYIDRTVPEEHRNAKRETLAAVIDYDGRVPALRLITTTHCETFDDHPEHLEAFDLDRIEITATRSGVIAVESPMRTLEHDVDEEFIVYQTIYQSCRH